MKKPYVALLLGAWAMALNGALFAQKLYIYDQNTNLPLQEAVVKSCDGQTRLNQTGAEGYVTLIQMAPCYLLEAEGYLPRSVSADEIKANSGRIPLFPNQHSVEEVVVSASKFSEKRKDLAQKVQVISQQELALTNQSSTADVLANSGNVFVQKSQLGGGSPIIRGFETNKVLMVVDGVRLNNAIYRGGHLQNVITMDNGIMDRVEVVFGPGSVVYGSDAIGGVMHFTTKNPTLSTTDKTLIKASAFTRYMSAVNGFAAHADVSVGTLRFASLTSFTYSNYGDLRQGAKRNDFVGSFGARPWYVERINGVDSMIVNADTNLQVGSAYSQYDVLQKFTFQQKVGVLHKLNFQLSNSSNIDRYDRLTQMSSGKPRFAEWYYGPQFRLMGAYSVELSNATSLYDAARVTVAYQSIEESRMDRRFKKNFLNHRIENLDIVTLNADFSKKKGEHEFRYGMDAWYNKVNSTAYTENIVADTTGTLDTRYPDGGSTMMSAAAYATHTWEINDQLILNDGLRASYVSLNAAFNDKTFFPFPFDDIHQKHVALNGNLGLIYMPNKWWRMSLNGSTAFRAPNVDDLSKVFESVQGSVLVPNPNLKAEYAYNGEFGVSRVLSEGLTVQATAYYTLLKNALTVGTGTFNGSDSVVYDGQLSQVMTTTNAGKGYVYGFEAMISGKLNDHLSMMATVNYTKGRNVSDSLPLDHIPPVFGKLAMVYTVGKLRAEWFMNYSGWKRLADYNMAGEDNFAYATPYGMPSWATVNARVNYNFSRRLSLQVACENILDQNYRNYASNISAPGRNFIVTLRGNF
ncbi:MAG: TonB-dependent receptor [Bacteroidetes bacterium]|nr:TonB-dependent receptor [Bacteroidota bacterium]